MHRIPGFRQLALVPARVLALAVALLALVATPAFAADPPTWLAVQGRLTAASGGPAPDGQYLVLVSLYAAPQGGQPLHEEIHNGVPVAGGVFALQVGQKKPLDPKLFVNGEAQWLGVGVAGEPELPRVQLLPVAYALRAATAQALACTGCVQAGHLDPSVLAPFAKTADLHKVALSGKFGDLEGGPDLSGVALLAGGNVFGGKNTFNGQVGVGKPPAALCSLDMGTDSGAVCVDGQPALLTRFASDQASMEKLAQPGQVVYRTDDKKLYAHVDGQWRKVMFQVQCGDGIVEGAEQCDDGKANADAPDKCRITCVKPACGDGIQDGGEQCDDGNPVDVDSCVACKTATCGDGKVHVGVEQCDDGNAVDTDACVGCKPAACGDGKVQAGVESCDDGNAVNTDACVACKPATCGDGFVQAGSSEECDDGAGNANTADKCRTSCKKAKCGDGIKDSAEACDDGNNASGDGCSAVCATENTATNGMGGQYAATGANKTENAKLACESHWGKGACCNDGCGSCNDRGYHKCGTPNCNGSTYWYYKGTDQSMGCGWVSANEVLISNDGKNWIQ